MRQGLIVSTPASVQGEIMPVSRKHPIVARAVPLIALYLLCDAFWLAGDNLAGLPESSRSAVRGAALILALLVFLIGSVMFAREASVFQVVAISSVALLTASVPIVLAGFLWFPSQFPQDTRLDQVLIWIAVELAMLCVIAAVAAAILAVLTKTLSRGRNASPA
jgi:cytochrome bd-type quinol oxidase subunit 2